ncbi:hypothetical protein [Sphingosinithalassobacter sp. LHW66-3]|uniref:hypothetical protein n=1 Tax=Sphingosinithalassobacter sp. LHW66-3 TaxID=3424718 RepID=UPI003D6AD59C
MKKIAFVLAGIGMAATAIPAAAIAAPAPQQWQNINQRQANLDRRIDMGVRNGSVTRQEAVRLRQQFRALERIEAQYRRSRPGLTMAERRDLDRRFDALSRQIRIERNDRQVRGQDRGATDYRSYEHRGGRR